ncbi:tRNA (adenosine(37)-N6)-threonylcarbamoyltransferase complex dimerization subunit type 1 TsaB [Halanaerobium salsuginis]|jgi:tRNA threonylcarbamoyladenosine biosynthesis protein TsaB|uniref:tRNA threonylcarbamoyladenosine biosynthesis protein TsaB n=1 Tax=Halanaerobium salsuginis TaxID=29563 RepID=A0A1I4H999_9FIRM|nr:tRNA (adenosine(37)-N6)-threonylcarbamoyltransferase complex dimerization subunit type 1 TsaB [Halanaerobium salsuginis]SFL37991.1 tRNA threonylcarbamoyladenosine biosynthesis protein TsaB [Halanaerobium salsuginis]
MLTLAIDTATEVLGLALLNQQQLVIEHNLHLPRQHSEKLLPLIESMFELTEFEVADLSGIGVTVGPGSFTGLRIGITTVKLLARIFKIPVKGVSSLELLAAAVEGEYLLPLFDARRKRVYTALYQRQLGKVAERQQAISASNNLIFNSRKAIIKPAGIEITKLPEILADYRQFKLTLLGEPKIAVKEVLTAAGFRVEFANLENDFPRAAVLARLAAQYLAMDQSDDIYQLKPAYLKQPQAEINWQQKYGKKTDLAGGN